jgi:hypothetical protein
MPVTYADQDQVATMAFFCIYISITTPIPSALKTISGRCCIAALLLKAPYGEPNQAKPKPPRLVPYRPESGTSFHWLYALIVGFH